MPLRLDPSYAAALAPLLPILQSTPKPAAHDIVGRRAGFTQFLAPLIASLPNAPSVTTTWHTTTSYDGTEIKTLQASPNNSSSGPPTAAILHAHGGGMIMGELADFPKAVALSAEQSGVQFFSIDYRVAPEHPHPTPINDVYAGLQWLHANAAHFNVDPTRIAIMGESAGGGIAAGVALKARDSHLSPPLAKQILIYPMLDDRNVSLDPETEPYAVWSHTDNITGWTALLGSKAGTDHNEIYASPAHATDLKGLPSTYIDVGALDIFRDEDMEYARRLIAAGVETEFHLYPGVPHAFEMLAAEISISVRAAENRKCAMTSF